MKKKAIGQIIACSIIGVILTGLLASAICVLPAVGVVQNCDVSAEPIRNAVNSVTDAFSNLPVPHVKVSNLPGSIWNETFSDQGYTAGNGVYETAPDQIDISWALGRVVVVASDAADQIRLIEWIGDVDPKTAAAAEISGTYQMRHKLSDGKLSVKQFRGGLSVLSTLFEASKTLLIELPKSSLNKLSIEGASVNIDLTDLSVEKLDVDLAAGSMRIESCTITLVDGDLASSKGSFTNCSIDKIDIDAAAAELTFDLVKTPAKIDIDAAAGTYRFELPADASFTADVDSFAASVKITGFANASTNKGKTVVGSGENRFDFDMAAGSVTIEARAENKF